MGEITSNKDTTPVKRGGQSLPKMYAVEVLISHDGINVGEVLHSSDSTLVEDMVKKGIWKKK